jgi:putative transcriptional regulator
MKKTHTTQVSLDSRGKLIGSSKSIQSRTVWGRVDALTDADIKRAAATDADTRILTTRDLKASYRVPEAVDVHHLRQKLRMSQGAFAQKYGFTIDALQDWEQGRVRPNRSARVLLAIIAREPEAVDRALKNEGASSSVPAASRRKRSAPAVGVARRRKVS